MMLCYIFTFTILVIYCGVLQRFNVVESILLNELFACFNTAMDIRCATKQVVVFESARYGRNDSRIAATCRTPYKVACELDVHFTMNRLCAGRQTCSVVANTATFDDPCGYEEFLVVKYRCVPVAEIQRSCQHSVDTAVVLHDSGFLASPNYPKKYPMDVECFWLVSAQRRQTISLRILDFALDVGRRGQRCEEALLEVTEDGRTHFAECGLLGPQLIEIGSNKAMIRFKTGRATLAQRGFILHYQAVGQGCPDLFLENGKISYELVSEVLYANATCNNGYRFNDTDAANVAGQRITCSDTAWDAFVLPCISVYLPTEASSSNSGSSLGLETFGTFLGIVVCAGSAVVMAVLMLAMFCLHCLRSRRIPKTDHSHEERRPVIVNNLQQQQQHDSSTLWIQEKEEDSEDDRVSERDHMEMNTEPPNVLSNSTKSPSVIQSKKAQIKKVKKEVNRGKTSTMTTCGKNDYYAQIRNIYPDDEDFAINGLHSWTRLKTINYAVESV